jgi:diguanylate cyclase (GGDEF)-like protein/PAS domain S-box-containing protein
VLVGGVLIGLTALHVWSTHEQVAHRAVSALRTDIALEQEGVLGPNSPTATLQAKVNADLSLLETTAVGTPSRAVIGRMTTAYQTAVSMELAALQRGAAQEATRLNATRGDPAFTTLAAELAIVDQEETANGDRGVIIAFIASLAIVVGFAVLTFLLALVARRRRDRVVAAEATASQFAHESRVASVRAESFRSLFDDNPQPMFAVRAAALPTEAGDSHIVSVNNAALHLYGYSRAEFLAFSLADMRPPEDHDRVLDDLHAARGGRTHFDNVRQCTKAGAVLDVELDIRPTLFDGPTAMIVCTTNVTDRVRLQRELEHQAFHDALTGLPNRSLFGDRLEHAHERLQRGAGRYAVLMVDLDNFKTVNDSLGHAAGDDLLVEVSRRLAAGIRLGDTAARLGGDEFAILLEDVAESADASLAADRLHNALRKPFSVGGRALTITATIGIASSSGGGAASDVVRNADVALYVGKANGYSVLSRLQGFPLDTLKIDLSFVRAIVGEDDEAPIVDAMISMGLSLGLKVVAEGVESEVQRAYLAKRGCSELQGYLISRPIGPEQLAAQIEASLAVTVDAVFAHAKT